MGYVFLHFLPNIIYNSTIFSVLRLENAALVLCIVHKKRIVSLVIVNKFDRLSKNDIFLKKMLDFYRSICYNRQAVLRKTQALAH